MVISDDALSHPVPVIRGMVCRARQSKEIYGKKMEQGMLDPKEEPATADLGQNPQIRRQRRAGTSGQVKTRTMIWTRQCKVTAGG